MLRIGLLAAAGLLAGCSVGPDFLRPAAPRADGYAPAPLPGVTASAAIGGGAEQRLALGRDVPADWWTLFGSRELTALVERALAANPGIVAATASLNQAQALVRAQQGLFFPAIGGSYQFQRQMLAGNVGGNSPGIQGNGRVISTYQNPGGPAPFNGPVTFNFHTATFTVGYNPDVFGTVRRGVEYLRAQRDTQRYQLEAAAITLASNVVGAAIQEAATREQIHAVREIIRVNEQGLAILQAQFRSGGANGVDLAAQEAQLAAARALLPPLDKQLEQTRDLIRALVGNLPDQDVPQTFTLDALRLPQEVPVSLPAELVNQRPDIRAAEAQLQAASASLGIAVANRLPVVNLTGNGGGIASVFSQMFSTGGPFWAAAAAVSAPLFDGNQLLNQQRAAREGLVQAAALYRQTVLTGFQNVADTLQALVADSHALRTAADAEAAARRTLDLTRGQAQAGLVNGLVLLTAEAAWQQAVLVRVQAQATRFGDTAALYQALGGGWWNRPVAS